MMAPVQNKYLSMKIVIADDSALLRDRIKNLLITINRDSVIYEVKNKEAHDGILI
jgi:hypothetical protein